MKALFFKILVLIAALLSLSGCLGVKDMRDRKEERLEQSNREVVKESTNVTTVSKPIEDLILTPVLDSGDEDLDERVDEVLSKLNTKKSSGNNEYSLSYDRDKREVVAQVSVGETKDEKIETNTSEKEERYIEDRIFDTAERVVKKMPWWLIAAIVFFLLPRIINILTLFINPASALIRGLNAVANQQIMKGKHDENPKGD